MKNRPRLTKLIVFSLVGYMVVLSFAVALHGHVVNERVESLIWESMLESEMAYIQQRAALDPDLDWSHFDVFHWYDEGRGAVVPAAFRSLGEGIHDEIAAEGKQYVVLVEQSEDGKRVLALDITDLESRELAMAIAIAGSFILVVVALTLVSLYTVRRLLRPLSHMANAISTLRPDGEGRRIDVDEKDAYETAIIAAAINGFTERIREHGERERNFITLASHELRTPIAVVAGINEVLLDHPEATPAVRQHLLRSRHVMDQMGDLVAVLLALARAPEQLLRHSQHVDVNDEVPTIVADHAHLCHGKDVVVSVELESPITVVAPQHIVRIAIGNLVRNAIENSDSGTIRIFSPGGGAITIEDPGHGMTPQEMSSLYTRTARSGLGRSGGIGIDLILRICTHFGWGLHVESTPGRGTRATLRFSTEA